jgi:hypothetical protein
MEDEYAVFLLKARLAETRQALIAHSIKLDIPPPPHSQVELVTNASIPTSLKRLILHLLAHQGSRTDTINVACRIGNVSDAHSAPTRLAALQKLGLRIECKTMKSVNTFGDLVMIGHLFLSPLPDNKLWQRYAASNDDKYDDASK